jgi:hypothetical protein
MSSKVSVRVVALLVCVILCTTACAVDPKKTIVGKWRDGDGDVTTYFPDGTFSVTTKDGDVTGKFSFPDQDHLKLQVEGLMAGYGPQLCTYSLSADVLKMTYRGKEDVLHRTK